MKIAVVVLADPTESARPRRLIRHLRGQGHDVVTLGSGCSDFDLGIKRLQSSYVMNTARFLLRRYDTLARSLVGSPHALEWLKKQAPDIVILHDLRILPWLLDAKGSWRLIVDLQEYYPSMLSSLKWRLSMGAMYRHIIDRYLHEADACWTVSGMLQKLYSGRHGIEANIVLNAGFYHVLKPTFVHSPLRLVHHGYALPDRNLEAMIRAVAVCPGAELDLVLLREASWSTYYDEIKSLANSTKNVRVLDPGPVDEIISSKNRYDLGLYVLAPENENMAGAMPNKLFDFVQARIGVVSGPFGEMAGFIEGLGVGFRSAGYGAREIADLINGLTDADVSEAKAASHRFALSHSFEEVCGPEIDRTLEELK